MSKRTVSVGQIKVRSSRLAVRYFAFVLLQAAVMLSCGNAMAGNEGDPQQNAYYGYQAGYSLTTGTWNSFFGVNAGHSTADGDGDTYKGNYNSFFGGSAGYDNIGSENSFFGMEAGRHNVEGIDNSFFGWEAGYTNTTKVVLGDKQSGSFNSFFGSRAGHHNTIGENNSFFGFMAGYSTSEKIIFGSPVGASNNSFVGAAAGYGNVSGSGNTAIGRGAGEYMEYGNYNVFLGYMAGNSETGSNKLYIDNCYAYTLWMDTPFCQEPLIYGEFDNRLVKIDGRLEIVTVATPSDIRYKKEIHPLASSLDKVLQLQGVSYEWDKDKVKGAGYKSGKQIGLIAQEVEKVLPELVYSDSKGYKTLSYDKLAPVLIEAMKEQQKEIKEKDSRIARLEKALEDMEKRLASMENPAKTVAME